MATGFYRNRASAVPNFQLPSGHARRDIHHALRIMLRNPGYAPAAMIYLGLGIGVNTTVFSWLDDMYFRPLPVAQPSRIVTVHRGGEPAFSWREYCDFAPTLRSLSGLAAVIAKGTYLDIDQANAQIYAEAVSANYFDVLGLNFTRGRAFTPIENRPDSERVVVISDREWSRHFNRDPRALGRSIRIEDVSYRIVGIAPPGFAGVSAPLAIDAWLPLATYPHYQPQLVAEPLSTGPPVLLLGRLAASQTLSRALAEFQVVDAQMHHARPVTLPFKSGINVRPATGYMWAETQRGLRPIATLLAAVVTVILLIACVNVSNLLLSRAAARQREMAARRALGAGPVQLLKQGITEGLVLVTGGAIFGLAFGYIANQCIAAMLPTHIRMRLYTHSTWT